MARSLNKAQLIGNLTRDPEFRYTPQGTAVCTFTVATNRQWKTDSGDLRDEADFHRVVAWDKLAEICSQMLSKGKKVFVEGRIQNRQWAGQDGVKRTTTEIVISDMLLLDRARDDSPDYQVTEPSEEEIDLPEDFESNLEDEDKKKEEEPKDTETKKNSEKSDEPGEEDIPF